jgi:hypothetical protein
MLFGRSTAAAVPGVLGRRKRFLRTSRRRGTLGSKEGGIRASGMGAFFRSAWW